MEGNQGKDLGLGVWLRGERLPGPIWALGSISSAMKSKAQNSKGRLEILRPTMRRGERGPWLAQRRGRLGRGLAAAS